MKETLEILFATTPGIIFAFVFGFVFIFLIIYVLVKILSNVSSVNLKDKSIKFKNKKKEKDDFKIFKNLNLIKSIIGDEYENFLKEVDICNKELNRENEQNKKVALHNAIEHLCLEFQDSYDETTEYPINRMAQVLELYLFRDLNSILLRRFDELRNSSLFLESSEKDLECEIQRITEDIVRTMKNKSRDYFLIDNPRLMHRVFDSSTPGLQKGIGNVIRDFHKRSKAQKEKIIELTKKRTESIEKKLSELLSGADNTQE